MSSLEVAETGTGTQYLPAAASPADDIIVDHSKDEKNAPPKPLKTGFGYSGTRMSAILMILLWVVMV